MNRLFYFALLVLAKVLTRPWYAIVEGVWRICNHGAYLLSLVLSIGRRCECNASLFRRFVRVAVSLAPQSSINMHKSILVASIILLQMHFLQPVQGQFPAEWSDKGKVTGVNTISAPDDWHGTGRVVSSWHWRGHSLAATVRAGDAYTLKVYDILPEKIRFREGFVYKNSGFPYIVSDNKMLFFKPPKVLIVDLQSGEVLMESIAHIKPSLDRYFLTEDLLWYQGYPEGSSSEWICVIELKELRAHSLIKGYYPAPVSRSQLFYTDGAPTFTLHQANIRGDLAGAESSMQIAGMPLFGTCPIPSSDWIVSQMGESDPRIALLNSTGNVLRFLPTLDHLGSWPAVSPSGKYVAYAHYAKGASTAKVVEVVDMDGSIVYQTFIAAYPITTAYRWSANEDRLAVLVPGKPTGLNVEIVTLD